MPSGFRFLLSPSQESLMTYLALAERTEINPISYINGV